MWRKMNVRAWNWQRQTRSYELASFLFFFTGKQKYNGSQINFPCSSAYLIHDAKDDLHYQVATSFLYDTIAASFIYTTSTLYLLFFEYLNNIDPNYGKLSGILSI